MGIQIRYEHGPARDEANEYDVSDFKEPLDKVHPDYHARLSALSGLQVGDVLATAYFSGSDALNDEYQHDLFSAYLEDLRGTDRRVLPFMFGVRVKEITQIRRAMPSLLARAIHPLLRREATTTPAHENGLYVEEEEPVPGPATSGSVPYLQAVPDVGVEESVASLPASPASPVAMLPVSGSREHDNIRYLKADEYIRHALEGQECKDWQSSARAFFADELATELKDGRAKALSAHIFDGADRSKKANLALDELSKWHRVVRDAGEHLGRHVLSEHQAIRFDDMVKVLTHPVDSRRSSVVDVVRRRIELPPVSLPMNDDTAKCLAVGLIASLYEKYKLASGGDERAS